MKNRIYYASAVLVGLLVPASFVQAASFDCAKAATKIENIICADAEISKLDEELNTSYKAALKNAKQATPVKQSQKLWIKERNSCADAVCVKMAYEAQLKIIASLTEKPGSDPKSILNQDEKDDALLKAVHTRNTSEVERLLAAGADPNTTLLYFDVPPEDVTPDMIKWADDKSLLHIAVGFGDTAIVELLLANRADPHSKSNHDGVTPLHVAVERNNREMVELLLSNGADINATTRDGTTPLFGAVGQRNKEMVAWLIARGADVNARGGSAPTPFVWAAYGGETEIMEMLISKGADINIRASQNGMTALHYAASSGKINAINLLIAKGVDVNEKDGKKGTPLHWASMFGYLEAVKLLLASGAEINSKDYEGQTPLLWTKKKNMQENNKKIEEVIKFLSARTSGDSPNPAQVEK